MVQRARARTKVSGSAAPTRRCSRPHPPKRRPRARVLLGPPRPCAPFSTQTTDAAAAQAPCLVRTSECCICLCVSLCVAYASPTHRGLAGGCRRGVDAPAPAMPRPLHPQRATFRVAIQSPPTRIACMRAPLTLPCFVVSSCSLSAFALCRRSSQLALARPAIAVGRVLGGAPAPEFDCFHATETGLPWCAHPVIQAPM